MNWQDLTTTGFEGIDRSTPVVLPVAAVEQHGPHLPLATDRLIAEYFAEELNGRLGSHVLMLPSMPVGCSEHHMEFAGSLTLDQETFMAVAKQYLHSAWRHGFRNFLVLNAHGGNQGVCQVLLEQFGATHPDCQVATATWWRVAAEGLLALNESGPGGDWARLRVRDVADAADCAAPGGYGHGARARERADVRLGGGRSDPRAAGRAVSHDEADDAQRRVWRAGGGECGEGAEDRGRLFATRCARLSTDLGQGRSIVGVRCVMRPTLHRRGLSVLVKAPRRVDDRPRRHRQQKRDGVDGEERVPAEGVEDSCADVRLRRVAEVADHVDEAHRDAGVAAADVDDRRPVGGLAEVERGGGDAHEDRRVALRLRRAESPASRRRRPGSRPWETRRGPAGASRFACTSASLSTPPTRQAMPPHTSGQAEDHSDFSKATPWTSFMYRGIQLTKNDQPKLPQM